MLRRSRKFIILSSQLDHFRHFTQLLELTPYLVCIKANLVGLLHVQLILPNYFVVVAGFHVVVMPTYFWWLWHSPLKVHAYTQRLD